MNTRKTRTVILALLGSTAMWAQSLSVPPSTAKRGGSGSLLLMLDSPPGKAPVALQWKLVFSENVTVALADIASGSAAESAQKALTCSAIAKHANAGPTSVGPTNVGPTFVCILAGGHRPIPNGPVANVLYRISAGAPRLSGKVNVENIIGVAADSRKVEMGNVEGSITVQ
jgi:hypothetical protein